MPRPSDAGVAMALLGVAAAGLLACHGDAPQPPPPAARPAAGRAADRAADEPPPGLRRHVQRLFTIDLPLAFERVRHDDAGRPALQPGDNLARFEDGRGRFVAVLFDPAGAGYAADATWRLEAGADRVRVTGEEPPCRRPSYATSSEAVARDEDECPAGDGRLVVAASADVAGHRFVFFFGDAAHEHGVDLAPFRAALASFRARGVVAAGAPAGPGG